MDDNLNEDIRLHSAGAIVRHNSDFASLKSHKNNLELTQEFINKWVLPFYMEIGNCNDDNWLESIKQIHKEITPDITLTLLGDFNWRTRLVGAYFSAIKNYTEQTDIIGTHFLKSEVCCVGHMYALVFAFYNNEKSIKYLTDYLEYYLQKPELYFDQESALQSLNYLDKINGTNYSNQFVTAWIKLQEDRKVSSEQKTISVALVLEQQEGKDVADDYLKKMDTGNQQEITLDIDDTIYQIKLMNDLKIYCK